MLKALGLQQARPPDASALSAAHNHPANAKREGEPTQHEQRYGQQWAQIPANCGIDAGEEDEQRQVPGTTLAQFAHHQLWTQLQQRPGCDGAQYIGQHPHKGRCVDLCARGKGSIERQLKLDAHANAISPGYGGQKRRSYQGLGKPGMPAKGWKSRWYRLL